MKGKAAFKERLLGGACLGESRDVPGEHGMRILQEAEAFTRWLVKCTAADLGLVVVGSENSGGWVSMTGDHLISRSSRLAALTPEAGERVVKAVRGAGGSVNIDTANALLEVLGEKPCRSAVGCGCALLDASVLCLIVGSRSRSALISRQKDRFLARLLQQHLDCIRTLDKAVEENRLLTHTLNCLLEVNKTILEDGSFEATLERIIESVKLIVGAEGAGLLLYDEDTKCLTLQKPAFGSYDEQLINSYRVTMEDGGNAVRVFQSRKPYLSNNVPEDPRFIQSLVRLFPAKSVISMPVIVNNRCIGVFHVINKPGGFTENDVALLKLLVSQLAVAIENARLLSRIRAEEAQSRSLYELSREFRLPSVRPLIELAAQKVLNVLPVSVVAVALRDKPGQARIVALAGIATDWLGLSIPLVSADPETKDLVGTREPLGELEAKAVALGMQVQVGVTVTSGSEALGKLLVWSDRRKSLSPSQMRFLSLVANQLAVALENANLFERERRTARRLGRYVEINERLVRLILEGTGIQAVTECLARYLDAGVIFYDHRLTRRAWAQVATENLNCLDVSFLRVLEKANGGVSSSKGLCELPAEGALPKKAFVFPVQVEGDILGYLCVLQQGPEQDEDLESIVERTLPVYALELLKERVATEVMQSVERDFVSALLGGGYSEEEMLRRASSLGYNLSRPYAVAVAEIMTEGSKWANALPSLWRPLLGEVKSFLAQYCPQSLAVTLHEQLIMLIPCRTQEAHEVEHLKSVLNKLRERVAKLASNRICLGLGHVAQGIKDMERSYKEACFVINYLKRTGCLGEAVAFRDLGLYQALADEGAANHLYSFARSFLEPLLKMDKKKGTAYLKTLYCYFTHGGNIKATAEGLFCHINTVRYRLERIQQLLKVDLNNVEHNFNLQMALKLAKFYYPELF